MTLVPFLSGLGLGASLIIAIGAQNAYVLRLGLRHSHAYIAAAVCTGVDWLLIAAGAAGFGLLVQRFPELTSIAAWGGALFLFAYGAMAFRNAADPGALAADGDTPVGPRESVGAVVAATLAVSLLNPHVYLDTVLLLGSVASHHANAARIAFVMGAWTASAAWFFGLAAGARRLAPVFARPSAWRVLDLGIGCVMWWIAATLVWGQLAG